MYVGYLYELPLQLQGKYLLYNFQRSNLGRPTGIFYLYSSAI